MYEFGAETVIGGEAARAWQAIADVDRWAEWDPHIERSRLEDRFEVGGTIEAKPRGGPAGTSTIAAVEPGRRWTSESTLPGGSLTGETVLEPLEGPMLRVRKTMRVSGPLTPLFRLWYGPRIRRDMLRTFAALERRIAPSA